MAILTKSEAIKDLPPIYDESLFKGVCLSLWLYLDKHWGMKAAINKGAEKHNSTKSAIEKLMRQVIPEEIIHSRMSEAARNYNFNTPKESGIKNQKLSKSEQKGKSHITSITQQ